MATSCRVWWPGDHQCRQAARSDYDYIHGMPVKPRIYHMWRSSTSGRRNMQTLMFNCCRRHR